MSGKSCAVLISCITFPVLLELPDAAPMPPERTQQTTAILAEKQMLSKVVGRAPAQILAPAANEPVPIVDPNTGGTLAYVVRLAPQGFVVTSSDSEITPVIADSATVPSLPKIQSWFHSIPPE